MEQRNVILAFGLSMFILLGWGVMFPPAEQAEQATQTQPSLNEAAQNQGATPTPDLRPDASDIIATPTEMKAPDPAEQAKTADAPLVLFGNDRLTLEINPQGWVTSAKLTKYRTTMEKDAPLVSVLGEDGPHIQYLNSGLLEEKGVSNFKLIKNETANGASSVHLRATLADGRAWDRVYRLAAESYLVEVEDTVQNGAGVKLFRQVVERYPNREAATFYEHAGPIGLMNDKLQEVKYGDLDEAGTTRLASMGGWTGIMDRYFITAVYGDQSQDYRYYYKGDGRSYQAGMLDDGQMDGQTAVFKSKMYIGPKRISTLKAQGVELERSVDFGWFAFIAKPLHEALVWLNTYVPNYGWCIILLLFAIKIIFFYPTQKSYQSMAAMRKLQPEQKRLQERFGDDRQRLGQEMMGLYKKHKVNPLGGCLPIIIQIPVFFALYKVLLMSIEMRQTPFIGWITDLSAQDPYYILPLLMGASMYIQMKLNPQPPDPMQAKVMSFLPLIFTVMFLFFPAGLVLYWVVNNVLSIIQQRLVMHKMGVD